MGFQLLFLTLVATATVTAATHVLFYDHDTKTQWLPVKRAIRTASENSSVSPIDPADSADPIDPATPWPAEFTVRYNDKPRYIDIVRGNEHAVIEGVHYSDSEIIIFERRFLVIPTSIGETHGLLLYVEHTSRALFAYSATLCDEEFALDDPISEGDETIIPFFIKTVEPQHDVGHVEFDRTHI